MPDRRTRLCQQPLPPALTGIDFVQVVDHTDQTVLHVFFIIDPDQLVDPGTALPAIPEAAAFGPADPSQISIVSQSTGLNVDIDRVEWISVIIAGQARTALEVEVVEAGDFSLYTFSYDNPFLDRFFAEKTFSFKQGCPTGLDCKGCKFCDPGDLKEVGIDYLARDWVSLRTALLAFASAHYPEWEHRVEADQAMMLLEIFAALGDEFAYLQDRYALEATLPTASQTQSIVNLARLVDYKPDRGQAATTTLLIGVSPGGAQYTVIRDPTGSVTPDLAFALREDIGPIPFQISERVYVHQRWNEALFYLANEGEPCLEVGATEVYLRIAPPDGSDPTEDPGDVALAQPSDVWLGRHVVLRSGVGRPDEPNRAWEITVTGVEAYEDPLDSGAGTLTRLSWNENEALPFAMPLEHGAAYFNAVRAVAGETVIETFRIGSDLAMLNRFHSADAAQQRALLALPRATERQGACIAGQRGRVLRFGLLNSPETGLSFHDSIPVMQVFEIDPDLGVPDQVTLEPGPTSQVWEFVPKILDADAEDRAFTVENGIWREIVRYRKPSGDIVHRDYASDVGFTVRFGDRAFGIAPADASIMQVWYQSAPGAAANLPPGTVKHTARPGEDGSPTLSYADWVTNPFRIDSARAPETLDSIRMNAPEAWKALLLRAVRREDYRKILERRQDLQAARATARWTGSWSTDFISVDPVDTTTFAPELRASIENELDCVRQAGRDVCLRDPHFTPIDIRVEVCLNPDASNSTLIRKITKRLSDFRDVNAFFHPDNLSFGDPLIRSELEAEIQCMAGVRAVESIKIRRRGIHDFLELEPRIEVAPHQILQLSNDPRHPEWGFLEVTARGGG